ncbi:MAG: universal stress protein [Minwuia sp.]|uniref:universal stress protein n=1 Tax=Minwuia sp. TaxID=2493630 RepID=UPI003A8A6F3C
MKNILVYLECASGNANVLAQACGLAKTHGARMTGVITPAVSEPNWAMVADGAISQGVVANLEFVVLESADGALSEFQLALEKHGLKGDTRVQESPSHAVAEVVTQFARRHSLAVIAQSPASRMRFGGQELPDHLVLNSGRPVLVVPEIPTAPAGRHIMVGWDGSREAARAVNDAMPLLQMAEKVTVIMVNPVPSIISKSAKPGAGIIQHLSANGVVASIDEEDPASMTRENVILSRASDLGIDMLVVGAYSTPRYRELIFGGVTRHLMHEMTVPILFSH